MILIEKKIKKTFSQKNHLIEKNKIEKKIALDTKKIHQKFFSLIFHRNIFPYKKKHDQTTRLDVGLQDTFFF